MADLKKISDLDPISLPYAGTEVIELDDGISASWKISINDLLNKLGERGTQSIPNSANSVTITFNVAESDTNYYPTCTLENTTLFGTPSIYGFVISAKTTTGFTVTFSGSMDRSDYVLNWSTVR